METRHRLPVSEIREWANSICDALELRGITEVTLEHDQYWSIFFDDAFDFDDPVKPVVGSLGDDIGDLRKEMEAFRSRDRGMVVEHACHHLQGILGYLAYACSGTVVNASNNATGGARA
ncbi:hypothetical protein [Microvirga roseola]|uniref:hypothetical protein n=1 Tax=Microvirga roseola TaxID=2883126 RepID=UPI001E3EA743|nr:hypothetical protein [Microvirga roseola]